MGKLAQKLKIGVHGELHVIVDNATLMAGEELTGSVELRVTKELKNANLTVRVWGCERMDWEAMEPVATAPTVPHRRSSQFLGQDIQLDEPGKTWAVGDYVYPFTCLLPADCPHSFLYESARIAEMENVRVEMMYRVTTKLEADGLLTANLEHETPFTIVAPPQALPVPKPLHKTMTADIKGLGFIKSGTCTVTLTADSCLLSPDETLPTTEYVRLATKKELKRYLPALHTLSREISCNTMAMDWRGQSEITVDLPLRATRTKAKQGPIWPTTETQFLWIGYRIHVECKFSMASSVKGDATVMIVPVDMVEASV